MAICHWPEGERPREKLLQRGPSALSDAELLAIFLRTGCKGKSAVDLARDLLTQFGGVRTLLSADQSSFCQAHGLGSAKYAQLQAVLELSRRHLAESLTQADAFTNPIVVKRFLMSHLQDRDREIFAVIFLDAQLRMLAYEELFQGTIDGARIYAREVVKASLQHNASSVIIAHNHPSGDPEPSRDDKVMTERLNEALALVEIRLLDHFVIGNADGVSFSERGWL
ncbi:RadC family protein [Marinibactrum halimedae]|uniref:UPF0758 protein n=1 Tax=Marinibactrum halimedae TaxID=1444977 RepID=A0AA37WQF6_9GAMM|nr:DNA repair protein RadC [Marinibactrum halimedae]MCD9458230.1 DNA repair protein RadC [Marinibactrum halimedae]GLS27142.1 UPF0758 protein [Marinibactrum halimedae]